jgi:exodeoxyribonuclease-3
MKIATWNVNSINMRIPHLMDWVKQANPDIVLLQELKATEDQFPRMAIEELGYNLAMIGQKTYNGVAILSKAPIEV